VLNTAGVGWFSSDRAVRDYDREVWHSKGFPAARRFTPSLAAFRASQHMQDIPSEAILQEEREERF
jgi:hypothetical protein